MLFVISFSLVVISTYYIFYGYVPLLRSLYAPLYLKLTGRKSGANGADETPGESTKCDTHSRNTLSSYSLAVNPKLKTLRISRIPKNVSRERLEEWLRRLSVASRPTDPENLIHFSVAPYTSDVMQATATFSILPISFNNVDEGIQMIGGPDQSNLSFDAHFDGMTILYDSIYAHGKPAEVDLIAVPGLGGHALGSWKSPKGHEVWLRDFLPKDMERIRSVVYGYNTNLKQGNWKTTIHDLAKSMLDSLRSIRDVTSKRRPIIFIGHSLGGLLVKQALTITADDPDYPPYQDILQNCCSVIFFGVPNHGIRYEELRDLVQGKRSSEFVRWLLPDEDTEPSEILNTLNRGFRRAEMAVGLGAKKGLDVMCYYETQRTRIPVDSGNGEMKERLLVTQSSATYTGVAQKPYCILPLEGDHQSMVKFQTPSDKHYESVRGKIQEFVKVALEARIHYELTTMDQSILHSLAFNEMHYRRYEVDKAHPGTYGWLLTHKSYLKWTKAKRQLLWIKGKPGSGKSTLMSHIHRTFNEIPTVQRSLRLEFFFHGRGTELQKTPIGMFRSLLHQLFKNVLPIRGLIYRAFEDKQLFGEHGDDWAWQLSELQDLFFKATLEAAASWEVVIFIDALDEVRQDVGQETRNDLVSYFHKLNEGIAYKNGILKICISCRHYPIVAFLPGLEISVEKHNQDDILSYVNTKLCILNSETEALNTDVLHKLANEIVTRASGVFQWVRLVASMAIRYYFEGESLETIAERIKELPELDDVYKYILQKVIDTKNRPRSLCLMQWICLGERPLSVTELRFALASDSRCKDSSRTSYNDAIDFVESDCRMIKLITTLSGGLAEVKHHKGRDIVQYIHQSMDDFLQSGGLHSLALATGDESSSEDLESWIKGDFLGRSQYRLFKSCTNYLTLADVGNSVTTTNWDMQRFYKYRNSKNVYELNNLIESFLKRFPFALYATRFWSSHAKKGGFPGTSPAFIENFGPLPGTPFENWIKFFPILDEVDPFNPRRPNEIASRYE